MAKEKFDRVKPHVNIGSIGSSSIDDFEFEILDEQTPYKGVCNERTRISNKPNLFRRRLPHVTCIGCIDPAIISSDDNRIWGDHSNYNERILGDICPVGNNKFIFHTIGIDDCQEPFLDNFGIYVNDCPVTFKTNRNKYKAKSGILTVNIYVCYC